MNNVKHYHGSRNDESAHQRARKHSEEGESSQVSPTTQHRFYQPHRRGRSGIRSRIAARLTRKLVTMALNMRNMVTHEILRSMQGQGDYLVLSYAA